MSRQIALRGVLFLALLGVATPTLAHHGAATFDTTNEITIKGTVSAWTWANPHCILHVDVKAPDGTVKTWSVASSNVADLSKRGWTRRTFAAGDAVTVTIQPAKSGEPVGMIRNVLLADGRTLQ